MYQDASACGIGIKVGILFKSENLKLCNTARGKKCIFALLLGASNKLNCFSCTEQPF